MKPERIQDFDVWKKAEAFSDALTAILTRPALSRNRTLFEQIENAVDSITANMSEGVDQPTDRGFANYLFIAKGSAAETMTRLTRACRRGGLSHGELHGFRNQADEVGKMLTGLIKHLMKTPNRRRGLGLDTGRLPTNKRKTDERLTTDMRQTDQRRATND